MSPTVTHTQLTLPRIKFTNAFAFGAPKLIGHHVTIWMLTYANMVIVNGIDARTYISTLLYSSNIGIHTSILFLDKPKKESDTLSIVRYRWEYADQRPNTHTVHLSCNVCHGICSWCPPGAVKREPGDSFTLSCLHRSQDGMKCTGRYVIAACPPSTPLQLPYVGTWYSYTMG